MGEDVLKPWSDGAAYKAREQLSVSETTKLLCRGAADLHVDFSKGEVRVANQYVNKCCT